MGRRICCVFVASFVGGILLATLVAPARHWQPTWDDQLRLILGGFLFVGAILLALIPEPRS